METCGFKSSYLAALPFFHSSKPPPASCSYVTRPIRGLEVLGEIVGDSAASLDR